MAKKQEAKLSLEEAMDSLNKKYGKGTVLSLNQKSYENYDLISTGSLAIDYIALGVGGFVKGKMYEIRGWEGCSKSTLCGHATANCQKNGGKVLYIDSEYAVDKNYFRALGVDVDDLIFCQPQSGDEGFQIAQDLIKTGAIDLVIIDSDNGLLPKSVIDGEMGDSSIGKKARLNSGAYPKLKSLIAENNTCMIIISQYREKIGVMFGDPRTTQGGHVLKYTADVILEMSRTLAKEGTDVYGNETKIKSLKNKMAPPYRVAEFLVKFGKGIDKISELISFGNDFKLLKKYGKTITYKENKYSLEEFETLLEDNPEFFDQIRTEVIELINNPETEFKIEPEADDI
jgi:recombination protein RecA